MNGTLKPRIKICCISSQAEAVTAIAYGADALGLVGNMPSGPGIIDDALIKDIAQNIPLFLAGGLNASNVREAIETVQPFGIDLCSGVRTDGQLDENKLVAFFKAVRSVN